MSQDIVNEVNFFLYSFAMGVVITFIYDWFLILRRLVRHSLFLISLEDLIFWIACAIGVFYMLYQENNGVLRWFAVLGATIGMLVYKRLTGKIFVPYTSKVLKKFFGVWAKIFGVLWKPVRKIAIKGMILLKKAGKRIRRLLGFLKKKLTVSLKLLKMSIGRSKDEESPGMNKKSRRGEHGKKKGRVS